MAMVSLATQWENNAHSSSDLAFDDVVTTLDGENVECVGANMPNCLRARRWRRTRPTMNGTMSKLGRRTQATKVITIDGPTEYGRDDTATATSTIEDTATISTASVRRVQKPRVASRCAAIASSTVKQPASTNSDSSPASAADESHVGDSYGFCSEEDIGGLLARSPHAERPRSRGRDA